MNPIKNLKFVSILLFLLPLLTAALPAAATPILLVRGSSNFPNPLNLTAVGTSDWRVWDSTTTTNNMSGGNGQISNYSIIGNVSASVVPWAPVVSWTNGNGSAPSSTNNKNDLVIYPSVNTTQGFSFTVPANTNVQTLYFYGATASAGNTPGTITVSISDGSSPTYTDSSFVFSSVMYAITYSAASAGQKLTVTWTTTGVASQNNEVELIAAALASGIGPLGITTTSSSLPLATQYQTNYSAPALTAIGGTPPYTWSITSAGSSLPEGMSLNPTTGVISSPTVTGQVSDQIGDQVGGQGGYNFQVQVKDSQGLTATAFLTINVIADSTLGGCNIFPPDSIFHQRVDSLPVDTSPAAPIPSAYITGNIIPSFGSYAGPSGPDGIPFIRIPWDQTKINIQWLLYGTVSDPKTSATTNPLTDKTIPQYPFPSNAPIENSANAVGQDQHVSVLQTAGGGQACQLYEVWQGTQANTTVDGVFFNWTASNGAHWDLSSDALRPLGWTSADAAGLPIMPLTINYDETCPGGQASPTSPCLGTVNHPIRFTLPHMLNAMVWPARSTSGVGSCTNANGTTTNQNQLISQSNPPVSCTSSAPAGEIYRLKKTATINGQSVPTSSLCPASTNPQAAAIITAMQDYGIILADNGPSGSMIGTPDARWNNADLSCLRNVSLGYFEPVNVSSLKVSPDSGATTSLSVNLTAVNTTPGTIVLTAMASEANGTIAGVIFNSVSSDGTSSQITGTEENTPPTYTMTLINQPAGATETFSATATDSNNISITSSQVSVTVPAATNTITTTVGANGTISPMDPSVAYGANQVFTLSPASGYQVGQVLIDGNAVSIYNNTFTLSDVTTSHTVTVSFTAFTNLITTTVGANGTISPMSPSVAYGANQTFTLSPATSYQVGQVLVDGSVVSVSNNTFTLSDVTTTHTVTVSFTAITNLITTAVGANGTMSPMNPSVTYGANQTFTLSPATGYQVGQVLVDGSVVSVSNNTFTLSDVITTHAVNVTFNAVASASVAYSISLTQPSVGGTISASATTVNSGSPVTLTAKAATGYKFTSWGGSVSGSTNPLKVNVTGNMSVTATFTATATYVKSSHRRHR